MSSLHSVVCKWITFKQKFLLKADGFCKYLKYVAFATSNLNNLCVIFWLSGFEALNSNNVARGGNGKESLIMAQWLCKGPLSAIYELRAAQLSICIIPEN